MSQWDRLREKSTEDLINIYQSNHADKKDAFYVLVSRFSEDLLQKCEINCARRGYGVDVAEIIAENTFKAFAEKGQFKASEGSGKTVDESFQFYLYRIARNQLVDYYRKEKKRSLGYNYDGTESLHHDLPPEVASESLDMEARIRYATVQALPPSHRTVLLTYWAHKKEGFNLPKNLQEKLRHHLGVQQNTIRSYKKEATDKIDQALFIYRMSQKPK